MGGQEGKAKRVRNAGLGGRLPHWAGPVEPVRQAPLAKKHASGSNGRSSQLWESRCSGTVWATVRRVGCESAHSVSHLSSQLVSGSVLDAERARWRDYDANEEHNCSVFTKFNMTATSICGSMASAILDGELQQENAIAKARLGVHVQNGETGW